MKPQAHLLTGSSGVYQIAADAVLDPLAAARVTERIFRHARGLMSQTDRPPRGKLKVVVLESAANSLRMASV
jgi:hypothetical protein